MPRLSLLLISNPSVFHVEHGLPTASVVALPHQRAGVAGAVLVVRALRLFMGTPFRGLDHIAVTRSWRNTGDATCTKARFTVVVQTSPVLGCLFGDALVHNLGMHGWPSSPDGLAPCRACTCAVRQRG
jgi:hypothetical protein